MIQKLGQNICNFVSTIIFFLLVSEKEQLQLQYILTFSCVEMELELSKIDEQMSHYEEKIQYVIHKKIYY